MVRRGVLGSRVGRAQGERAPPWWGEPPLLSVVNGAAFRAHAGYSYVVPCWATVLLGRQSRTASTLFRRQVTPLLVGTAIPTVAPPGDHPAGE